MIDLDISGQDLYRLAVDVGATEDVAQRALKSTLNKMAAWVKTRTTRSLSDALQIKQHVIRRRVKAMKRSAGVWYGLNDLSMIYLNARKAAGGVRADGDRFERGAFIAHGVGSKALGVFKRAGAKRLMTKGRSKGKMRQPIEKVSAAIEQASLQTLNSTINAAEFEARFFQVYEHELQWRMQTR